MLTQWLLNDDEFMDTFRCCRPHRAWDTDRQCMRDVTEDQNRFRRLRLLVVHQCTGASKLPMMNACVHNVSKRLTKLTFAA